MDDQLVDPAYNLNKNVPDPSPPVTSAQAPSAPAAPQPGSKKSFQNSKAFIILPIILIIIVIAAGSFLISNKHASTSTVSTSAVAASKSPTTTVASTTLTSPESACPCLNEQQFEQMLNVSAKNSKNATFNVTFASNNSAIRKLQSSNPEANKTAPPAGVLDNITEAWVVSYNALAGGSASEVVMKSSNITGFINYFDFETSSSGSKTPLGTVNGFHYLYIDIPIFGVNTIAIEGYENDYIIAFGLGTSANTTIGSVNTITTEISSAA